MSQPLAMHVIACARGFWLPNDPRGSQSFEVRSQAQDFWKVFLFTDAQIRNAIRYVEQNPLKEGKRVQRWTFVTPFVR